MSISYVCVHPCQRLCLWIHGISINKLHRWCIYCPWWTTNKTTNGMLQHDSLFTKITSGYPIDNWRLDAEDVLYSIHTLYMILYDLCPMCWWKEWCSAPNNLSTHSHSTNKTKTNLDYRHDWRPSKQNKTKTPLLTTAGGWEDYDIFSLDRGLNPQILTAFNILRAN